MKMRPFCRSIERISSFSKFKKR